MMPETPVAGRYELIEQIGSGGMGSVWRGYDSVLDREVAVKLIRPDMLASPQHAEELVKRFRREARVTARIHHHGVPQVYDAVLDSSHDRLYLVMELIRGTSLRAYISADDPPPIAWAAAVAAQIATVLSHAHAVPVVHRDLKPGNVLVTDEGTVKVLDFGIAAILRTDVTKITPAGRPMGTSKYMSPEQVRGVQVTPHSDLYALGCILYEVLCGRPVFTGDSEYELWRQHISVPPRPPSELRDGIPADLERLVLQLLDKSPERRPPDAYAVYERLLPFLPAPGSAAPAVSGRLHAVPDPTLMYRRPNAPHPRPQTASTAPARPAPAPATALDTGLREAIKEAVERSNALLEEERFAQAADALQAVIGPAAEALGTDNSRVLKLRMRRAAILVLGGDARRALAEFDALAAAYARAEGPASSNALECRRQAAYCRAELGQSTAALKQFREVLQQVSAQEGDASPTALDLRRSIGVLLLSQGDATGALEVLEPLHQDLCLVYGPDHAEAQEVAELLARIRFEEG